MELTDQALVAAALKGNKESFDLLVLRYLNVIYTFVFYYLKNQEDAEDITQEVFVKVMRHLKTFDEKKKFKPWILQIAKHQALDWLKKKKPFLISQLQAEEGESLLDQIPDPAPLADLLASQQETWQELRGVVHQLSPIDQRILFFRYMKGFSFQEIADELTEVMDTVKSRHRRAMIKLRDLLAKHRFFAPLEK